MNNKRNIKISIVTICYNSAATIEHTIKSVLDQNYHNLDYVIIDGGSTDSTLSIVNKYREQISTIISEKDHGISDAFNKGIKYAKGDVICFINSDDVMISNSLQVVANAYDGRHDIYCGNVILENTITGYKCREIPSTTFPIVPLFRHVAHQGMFITPETYKRCGGYDINIRYPMDLDFLVRAYHMGAKFKHINKDIACFRSGGATSTAIYKKKRDYLYVVQKNGGNIFQAYFFYYFLVSTQIIKKFLNLFGSDFSQKLRYKKSPKGI